MTLIFFTSSFPYPPGEQFIETEIKYIAESKFDKKLLFPHSAKGLPREVPENIEVHEYLDGISKLNFVFKASINNLFLKEIKYLIKNGNLRVSTVKQALKYVALVLRAYTGIKKWCQSHDDIDVAYVYWNSTTSYAACLAKKNGMIKKVVTRAHGGDLYEERQESEYMPLKRRFVNDFDQVHALSEEGKEYLISQYGFKDSCVWVSPLGVDIPLSVSSPSSRNDIIIVSVSFCHKVKRIDKIIDSIALFASERNETSVKWSHIGGGQLLDDLQKYAENKLASCENVKFDFLGSQDNKFVLRFYQENDIDLFINLSESEGVPVSVMESMAAGIPAIATDVGGVSSLVDMSNGYLLDPTPTILEVSEAIRVMQIKAKDVETRNNARMKIINKYNAEKNYRKFVADLY